MQFRSALFFLPLPPFSRSKDLFSFANLSTSVEMSNAFFREITIQLRLWSSGGGSSHELRRRGKKKIVSLQKSLRFKPLRQSTNLVNKLNFHNKSCCLCCFPALGMFLKAPPPRSPSPRELFLFSVEQIKDGSEEALITQSTNQPQRHTHIPLLAPPPSTSLIIRGNSILIQPL